MDASNLMDHLFIYLFSFLRAFYTTYVLLERCMGSVRMDHDASFSA